MADREVRRNAPRLLTLNVRRANALWPGYESQGELIEEGLRKVGLPES